SSSVADRTWAQGIIDAHPGKPTMISTHGYMADNGTGRDGNGNNIWNDLVNPNAQVFMVFCGHDWVTRHEIDTTTDGRKVLQLLVDWQQIINGGNGWLQLLTFDPDNSRIHVNSYSPFLDLNRTDFSSQFSIDATFNSSGTGSVAINGLVGPTRQSWTGAGGDANWQTAANWGGTAPSAGDMLVFRNQPQKVSTNNYPAGTAFAGMHFTTGTFSNGYTFGGNQITLTGDVVNGATYGPNTPQTGPKLNMPIVLSGDRQFNTGDWDMTLNGVVSGNGSLTKTHGRDYIRGSYDGGVHIGDLYLTNVNTYTGDTKVTGGALFLTNNSSMNSIAASATLEVYYHAVLHVGGLQNGTLVLSSGQTLKGRGRVVGNTSAPSGSTISPGHADPNTFEQMGNLTMATGSNYQARIGGKNEGEYAQIEVTGTVDLGGATLNLAQHGSYTPQVGDELMILENDASDAVINTFVSGAGSHHAAGTALPEGAIVSTDFLGSGLSAQISYLGGTGNDITLAVLPPPGPPVFTNDPMSTVDATLDLPYQGSIAGSALDSDGDPLIYSKVNGPAWLTVNPGGSLSGTPAAGDLGINSFTVQVSDDNGNSDTATLQIAVTERKLVGYWDFENSSDLAAANVGSALGLTGAITSVAGPGGSDAGAAAVDVNEFLTVTNPIGSNGGGTRTNEYTLLLDFKIPTLANWIALFDTSGGGDGDYFYSSSRGLGVSSEGYIDDNDPPASVLANTWYRMVVTVDQGGGRSTYVNGVLVGNHGNGIVDGTRWSLGSTFTLFSDNGGGEEAAVHVSGVRLFNKAMSASEVAGLGDIHAVDTDGDCVVDAVDPDDDNDGMPDAWETANGLNSLLNDRDGDADGDGFSNWHEYIAQTDPQGSTSKPAASVIPGSTSGEYDLAFSTSSSRYYTVECSDTLATGSWQKMSLPVLGTGSDMTVPLNTTPTRRFYRVLIDFP
ncbi:MAG: LamG-like jellyroll fold domain-containing protein, partial [Akkermansiaceae bacterium]